LPPRVIAPLKVTKSPVLVSDPESTTTKVEEPVVAVKVVAFTDVSLSGVIS
jgi:hypothetical protein